MKDGGSMVELMLRLGYRFPTGSVTGAARYTDSPGYYFDLTAGKPLSPGGPLKLLGLLGFYVWQTNQDLHFQDDAFLFGAGLEYNQNNWRIDFNSVGYLGYMSNGDKPIVVRIGAQKIIRRDDGNTCVYSRDCMILNIRRIEDGNKISFGKVAVCLS